MESSTIMLPGGDFLPAIDGPCLVYRIFECEL